MGTCLPWFSVPSRDTRHLTPPGAWWAHCEAEFEKMFMRCGFSALQAQKIAPAIRPKILQPARYHLYADAISTLQTLQKRGYQNYMLSNNFPELEEIVTALGLRPYFKKVLVSGQIGYDKPRKEIFDFARQQAGNPAECWMIGDNLQDDIVGGQAAGFTTVLVYAPMAEPANFAVQNLSELLALLP
ncbi:HAD family hydrolase [Ruminococcaceae bacterium OttesenSCG-928-A16]|nr:HAD family hydrolase [Ruminococcaceae bacterium OttesenSCG-928-A16]